MSETRRRKVATQAASVHIWRGAGPTGVVARGDVLILEDAQPFVLHFGPDGWQQVADRASQPIDGGHVVRFEATELEEWQELAFTRFYPEENRWEGIDHVLQIDSAGRRKDDAGLHHVDPARA